MSLIQLVQWLDGAGIDGRPGRVVVSIDAARIVAIEQNPASDRECLVDLNTGKRIRLDMPAHTVHMLAARNDCNHLGD